MATFSIRDLADNRELDHDAMAAVHGGLSVGHQGATQTAVTTVDSDAGRGSKAQPHDLQFFHYYDKASPVLA